MLQSAVADNPLISFPQRRRPAFQGTRVPVQTLLDYLEAGDSIDTFLDDFPTVTRAQVVAALEVAKEKLLIATG